MIKLRFAAILSVVAASVSGQEKSPQHLLRLSFADDGPTWFRVQQDMTVSMNLNGQAKDHCLRLDLFWRTRIEGTNSGAAVVVHTLARLRAAGRDDGQDSYTYDSAADATAPARLVHFAELVDIEITRTIDPTGHVRGLDLPQVLQDLDRRSGVKFMTATDMIRPLDLQLPELPVAVGDSWRGSNARSLAASDEFAFESEYKLVSVEKGKARIEQRFVMTAAEDEKQPDRDMSEPDAERSPGRRANRTFTLDLSTGRVARVEEQGTLDAEPSDQPKIRMTLTTKRVSYATVEPTEDLEPLAPPASGEKKK